MVQKMCDCTICNLQNRIRGAVVFISSFCHGMITLPGIRKRPENSYLHLISVLDVTSIFLFDKKMLVQKKRCWFYILKEAS